MTSIGNNIFYNSGKIEDIVVNLNNDTDLCNYLQRSDISKFFNEWYSKQRNIYIAGKRQFDLLIPNSVTSIENYALYGCSGLTSVIIPNSVEKIGKYAFDGCIYEA